MQKITIFSFFTMLTIASCISKNERTEKKVENIVVSPVRTLDRISDSILVGRISSITAQENIVMIGDGKNNRVLVTDANFKLKYILGKLQGNGPGEFNYVKHHLIKDGRIYANDRGNNRINIFNTANGEFIKSIKLRDRTSIVTAQFYLDNDNNIYYSTDPETNGKMLLKLDSNGKIIKKFGDILQKAIDPVEQINTNFKEMVVANNRIISVGRTLGVVEIHDLNGNKINSFDISKYEPIKTNSELVKNNIKADPSAAYILHGFCYVRGEHLYIGPADWTPTLINKRDIMVFKWSDTSCELIKTINFKTNKDDDMTLFEPYFVSEDEKTIYAQGGSTKKLYTFKMP